MNASKLSKLSEKMNGILIALVMLVMSSLSACSTGEEREPANESWEIGTHWRYSPQSIWGDTFVTGEYIFGQELEGQYITVYNLQTREKRRLTEIPLDYRFEEPSIYEDKVIWSAYYFSEEFRMSRQKDFDTLNWDVFLLNIKTGEIRQITTDEHVQRRPRIYGDTIVWLDNRHEEYKEYPHHYDVYAYSIKTGEERRITTTNSITDYDLAINGDLVVWTDSRNDDPASRIGTRPPIQNDDIYLYDLSTNQEQRVTTDPGDDSSPAIDNGRIVWLRQSAVRNIDVFLYEIETEKEIQISESSYVTYMYYPSIYGDRIAWADARLTKGNSTGDIFEVDEPAGVSESGSAEIYLYDLGTKRETLLVPSKGTVYTETIRQKEIKTTSWQVWLDPVIQGDFIVYTLSRQVDPATYAMKLDNE